jgi:hypothetical protein
MSRSDLTAALGPTVSRRVMMQSLGLGLVGAALAPRAKASELTASPQPQFSYSDGTSIPSAPPALATGAVVVVERDNTTKDIQSWVRYVETTTGEVQWSHAGDGVPRYCTPVVDSEGNVYVAHSTTVLSLDPAGTVRWSASHDVAFSGEHALVHTGSTLLLMTTSGRLLGLDPLTGGARWGNDLVDSAAMSKGFELPLAAAGMVVVLVDRKLHAVSLANGFTEWHHDAGPEVVHRPTAGHGYVVFTHDHGDLTESKIIALDLYSGDIAWTHPAIDTKAGLSAPSYVSGAFYYGDAEGNFVACDVGDGAPIWHTTLSGDLTYYPMVVEAGIAYVSAETSSGTTIHAVDLADEGAEVVDYDPPFTGARMAGVESGTLYLGKDDNSSGIKVIGVNLASVLGAFVTESELMAKDYVAPASGSGSGGTTPPTPSTASWRTSVRILDTTKAPRPNTPVKVWTSTTETVTVDVGASTVTLTDGRFAWVTTDAAGELSLVVDASSITSPALYLWCPFMQEGEAMVVYPDHDALTGLSQVTGSQLTSARTYSSGSLLTGNAADSADHVAATVRKALGNTGSTMSLTQSRLRTSGRGRGGGGGRTLGSTAPTTSYIAFPDDTDNLVQQPIAQSTDRAYTGSTTPWSVTIGSDDTVVYSDSVPALAATKSKSGGFEEFLEDVVRGGARVKSLVWRALKKDANAIEVTAEKLYKFTVDTLEKAASLVVSVFTTIVKDIVKVAEAISSVFDWGAVVGYQQMLASAVKTQLATLPTMISSATATLSGILGSAESTIQAQFSTGGGKVKGTSMSATPGASNPQQVYGAGGAKSWSKSKWGTDKVKHNVGSVGTSFAGALAELSDLMAPAFSDIAADLETAVTTATTTSGPLLRQATDASSIASAGADVLLALVAEIVEAFLDFAQEVVDSALSTLEGAVNALTSLLDAPIDIPVVSDLWKLIDKGNPLTLLNLVTLLAAIPGIVIKTALSSDDTDELGADLGLAIGFLVTGAVFTIFDAVTDWLTWSKEGKTPTPLAVFWCVLSLAFNLLSLPDNDSYSVAITALGVFVVALVAVNTYLGDAGMKAVTLAVLTFVIGLGGLVVSVWGLVDRTDAGSTTAAGIANIASSVPWLFKLLYLVGYEATWAGAAIALIDGVCDAVVVAVDTASDLAT